MYVDTAATPGKPISDAGESETKVRNVLCAAEEQIARITDSLIRLEKRLDVGLTPVPPQVVDKTAPSPRATGTATSHLHDRLSELRSALARLDERVNWLAGRVEL